VAIADFLTGVRVLEETHSSINGKLTVVKDLVWGTYIKAGGLTQSGGVAKKVWQHTLKQISDMDRQFDKCLILGLGGGSGAMLVRKYWPSIDIVGIDLDPVVVGLGKKYLGLDNVGVRIRVQDGQKYCQQLIKKGENYDLILVDMYVGDRYPEKFERKEFMNDVGKVLSNDGLAVFNRLYYDEKRKMAMKFGKRLEKVFQKVAPVFPEANIMFVCSKELPTTSTSTSKTSTRKSSSTSTKS
jgi:spermidine synthase